MSTEHAEKISADCHFQDQVDVLWRVCQFVGTCLGLLYRLSTNVDPVHKTLIERPKNEMSGLVDHGDETNAG
jgi:hypothetical protein